MTGIGSFEFNVEPTQQFTFEPNKLRVAIVSVDQGAGTFVAATTLSTEIPNGVLVESRQLTLPIAYLEVISGYNSIDNTGLNQILAGFHLQLVP